MKSLTDIKYDIQSVLDKIREKPTPELKLKYLNLSQVYKYMETNPSEEFVRSQLEKTDLKIRKIIEAGPDRETYRYEEGYKNDMKKYEKTEGLDKIRKQKSTLEYILNIQ